MKLTSRLLFLQILAITVAFTFATRVYAEPPHQEIIHAYYLLKQANNNYEGHKQKAIEHVQAAGKALNLKFENMPNYERERQWKSDQMLAEARNLLSDVRDKFEAHDRERAAAHINKAIAEINEAIGKEPIRQRYGEPGRINDPYRR
jgi:hypothetical protein